MGFPSSLKWQIRVWRARYSIPSLLARANEETVVSIVAAINGGVAVLIIGIVAGLVNLPLLFPALGPSAFLMSTEPFSRTCRPRSILLAHHVALLVGVVAWQSVSLISIEQSAIASESLTQILGAALSLAIVSIALVLLGRPHPPACATAMIVGMGGAQEWTMLLGMSGAVFLLVFTTTSVIRLAGLDVVRNDEAAL